MRLGLERNLFPKVPHTRRRRAAAADRRTKDAPYTSEEIGKIRQALVAGEEIVCPRCQATLQSSAPARRSETGALVWRGQCDPCGRKVNVRAIPRGSVRPPDFADLMASDPPRERLAKVPRWAFSAAVHGVLAAGAVVATQRGVSEAPAAPSDTMHVVLFQENRPEPKPAEPNPSPPPALAVVAPPPLPKGFQTLAAPIEVPVDIPPVDATHRIDPRDFMGIGIEGGVWDGWAIASDGDGDRDQPIPAGVADEPPEVISSPKLRFPETLRAAGIQGFVVVGFVVDTMGRAEPQSINIVVSTSAAFEASAKEVVRKSRYRPARMRGRPVRSLATMRVDFSLLSNRGGND